MTIRLGHYAQVKDIEQVSSLRFSKEHIQEMLNLEDNIIYVSNIWDDDDWAEITIECNERTIWFETHMSNLYDGGPSQ